MAVPTPEEYAQILYDSIKDRALAEYSEFVLSRTPANLQEAMQVIIDEQGPPPPLDDDQVIVTDGDSIVVHDHAGTPNAKSPGIAGVADKTLDEVTLAA